MQPSYLSKFERGQDPPRSEAEICALAREPGGDADVLLALAWAGARQSAGARPPRVPQGARTNISRAM